MIYRKTEEYEQVYNEANKDPSSYLINPVNSFLLTKRLTSDWLDFEDLMYSDNGRGIYFKIEICENLKSNCLCLHTDVLDSIKDKAISTNITFPTNEDLKGAANALTRLQETYNLNTSHLANGEINGVQYR